MPTNKDLKRRVRERMQKTGEAYTAARAQILARKVGASAPHAELAGMSDAAVAAKTQVLHLRIPVPAQQHRQVAVPPLEEGKQDVLVPEEIDLLASATGQGGIDRPLEHEPSVHDECRTRVVAVRVEAEDHAVLGGAHGREVSSAGSRTENTPPRRAPSESASTTASASTRSMRAGWGCSTPSRTCTPGAGTR